MSEVLNPAVGCSCFIKNASPNTAPRYRKLNLRWLSRRRRALLRRADALILTIAGWLTGQFEIVRKMVSQS